jgi:hypothetical protein
MIVKNFIHTHQKKAITPGMVIHTCNNTYSGSRGRRITSFEASPCKGSSKTPSQKQNKNKRAGVIAQVVECLPSIPIPSTEKWGAGKLTQMFFNESMNEETGTSP